MFVSTQNENGNTMIFDADKTNVLLRDVLFSNETSFDLKQAAFEILVEAKLAEYRDATPVSTIDTFQTARIPTRVYSEISRLLRDGRKIEAIKVLRSETGWGLKDSKDVVDTWKF